MWIRSQDKIKLGDYKFIFINGLRIDGETQLDVDTLGEYETKDRATEVLNSIHGNLVSKKEKVFQMPSA